MWAGVTDYNSKGPSYRAVDTYLQTLFHGSLPSAGHVVYQRLRGGREKLIEILPEVRGAPPNCVTVILWRWRGVLQGIWEKWAWGTPDFQLPKVGGMAREVRGLILRHSKQRKISIGAKSLLEGKEISPSNPS